MDDWEREQIVLAAKGSWEDEEDVADSWDAEEDEEVEVAPKSAPVKAPVKATPSVAAQKAQATVTETAQERKERLERAVKESDLENAMALFGIAKEEINVDEVLEIQKAPKAKEAAQPATTAQAQSAFDSANPQTWSEFESFSGVIVKKILTLQHSKHYPNFLEHLFRSLLTDRDIPEIRKLANMANEAATAKQRDKLNAAKKKAPSLSGAGKKVGGRADMMDFGGEDDHDDPF